jgi:hypothetical protein
LQHPFKEGVFVGISGILNGPEGGGNLVTNTHNVLNVQASFSAGTPAIITDDGRSIAEVGTIEQQKEFVEICIGVVLAQELHARLAVVLRLAGGVAKAVTVTQDSRSNLQALESSALVLGNGADLGEVKHVTNQLDVLCSIRGKYVLLNTMKQLRRTSNLFGDGVESSRAVDGLTAANVFVTIDINLQQVLDGFDVGISNDPVLERKVISLTLLDTRQKKIQDLDVIWKRHDASPCSQCMN